MEQNLSQKAPRSSQEQQAKLITPNTFRPCIQWLYIQFQTTTVAQFILQQLCTYKRVRHNVSVTLQALDGGAAAPRCSLALSHSLLLTVTEV